MYGIYDDLIISAEKALEEYGETKELLEYPEVQADKAYYLSVLSKYNQLNSLRDKLEGLKSALKEEKEVSALLSEAKTDGERETVYEEISSVKLTASKLAGAIADAIGCRRVRERVYCRFKFGPCSAKLGLPFSQQISQDLQSRGAIISDFKSEFGKEGYLKGISFTAEGEDIIARLSPITGAHTVGVVWTRKEEICFAVTPAPSAERISEKDLKINVFHSSGAGGQNINKVETAVRVTHIPTGTVVVCQDERSQLKNKKRAIETIEKKIGESVEKEEKKRIEADIYAQFRKKNTPIFFDMVDNTMTDSRLQGYHEVPFPLEDFSAYLNAVIAKLN